MFSGFPQVQSIRLRRLFQPRRTEFRGYWTPWTPSSAIVQNCARGNTNREQLSLPRERIVAEAIQISTGAQQPDRLPLLGRRDVGLDGDRRIDGGSTGRCD